MNPVDRAERWPIERLIPYARNARTHSDAQIAQIAASIREWGWTTPILADEDGTVLAGHGRLAAARQLQMQDVPVIIASGWSDAKRRAYILADNKLALNAGWDDQILALELADLGSDFDLNLVGFTPDEVAALTPEQVKPGLTDDDAVPDVPEQPITVLGDIWLLGKHRLMCGDSTSVDAVDKLMDGQKADICFTSPPYALGKSIALSGNKARKCKDSAYESHKDDPALWSILMNEWWAASFNVVSHGWVVNVQPPAGNKRQLMQWINDRIDKLVDIATWDKGHAAPPMAAGVMASRYEWFVVFGENNASRVIPCSDWRGTIQSVYNGPGQKNNDYATLHAATMPCHVAEWVIGKLCNTAKSIFEPFCGTGTILVAAEKWNRQCCAMELDPKYCDVIVKRWQDYTGQQAIHAETGRPFSGVSEL